MAAAGARSCSRARAPRQPGAGVRTAVEQRKRVSPQSLGDRSRRHMSQLAWRSWSRGGSRNQAATVATLVGSGRPRNTIASPSLHRSASRWPARCRAASEASRCSGCCLASSHSRAASLTGSPITVYSKRSAAPTLPATTCPAEAPTPAATVGSSCSKRPRSSRAAARAPPAGFGCSAGAPNTHSAASPLELVDPAAVATGRLDHDREEPVQGGHDLRGIGGDRRRADQVDEQDGDLAPLPAELCAAGQCVLGDLLSDVAAEQVANALPLAQPRDHAVEPSLQQADLVAVVDGHLDVGVATLHLGEGKADRLQWIRQGAGREHCGGQAGQQRRQAQEQDGGGQAAGASSLPWPGTRPPRERRRAPRRRCRKTRPAPSAWRSPAATVAMVAARTARAPSPDARCAH